MEQKNATYWRYWGKARKEGEVGAPYHLLVYHCLDVAAVGAVYLDHHPALRRHWAERLELPESVFVQWLTFFLTQHDLGKFSYRFQGLRQDLTDRLGNPRRIGTYSVRHDTLGFRLWGERIWPMVAEQSWFGPASDRNARHLFETWTRIVTGHHGQPPKSLDSWALQDHFAEPDQQAALAFAAQCADFLLPGEVGNWPYRMLHQRLRPLSWWLAGLAVLADWVGSSEEFFAYRGWPASGEPQPLRRYWNEAAKPQAERALRDIGLLPSRPRAQTLTGLFPYLAPPSQPTPLQQVAADLAWEATPQLFFLEDVTGAGKTEAALMLAHRLIAEGAADGFYFGLPTMATSNAMFRRIVDGAVDERLYADKPSLVLAHSASRLAPVLDALLSCGRGGEADYAQGDEAAGPQRSRWFSDSRKKALLAHLGVGTIDQALLAILFTRHQSLRLFGLARKVLIVDEVHACDAYMLRLLETLLEFHGAAGGSAILLSATLPAATRSRLAVAYRRGSGGDSPALSRNDYPLLTRVGPDTREEIPLATRPEVARSVGVQWLHADADAIAVLLAAREADRCACWIRNTVDDAIAAFEALRAAKVPEDDLILFHARFALGDRVGCGSRSGIESRVLRMFGPDSTADERRGKIAIFTQVIESSVDCDLDVMISDLAPVDLLIQRAGRLCRHVRDHAGNRAKTEGRSPPVLHLFAPPLTASPQDDWIAAAMPGTAAVYPDHGRLWLTASRLRETGRIAMPEDARDLIEGVYGDGAEAAIPAALLARSYRVAGHNSAKQTVAAVNVIRLEDGYVDQGFDPWDDALTPTRLEDSPSVTVRLARWENGEARPWIDAGRYSWELSQLSVRVSLLSEEIPETDPALQKAVAQCKGAMPDHGNYSRLLVLRMDGEIGCGRARNRKGETVELAYDQRQGLRRTGQERSLPGPPDSASKS